MPYELNGTMSEIAFIADLNGIDLTKSRYKAVYLDLPFLIQVTDNIDDIHLRNWLDLYKNGVTDLPHNQYAPSNSDLGNIIFGGRYPVYVPDKFAQPYIMKTDCGATVELSFIRRMTQARSEKLCGEISGDRTGRASYSSVNIMFDTKETRAELSASARYYASMAIGVVNKFIDYYRYISDKFYIYNITPQVIQKFIVSTYDEKMQLMFNQTYITDKAEIEYSALDENDTTVLSFFVDATFTGMGSTIGFEKEQELRNAISKNSGVPTIKKMRLDVLDKLDLHEWTLAIVESAIMFETWLNQYIRKKYIESGLSDDEIDDKFRRDDRNRTPHSSYTIATKLLHDATGYNFEATDECSEWSRHTKDVRNEIVHGKRISSTKSEAWRSYNAALAAINTIESNA